MNTIHTNFVSQVKNTGKNWWIVLVLGIILIVTGICTLPSPLQSFIALSIVFSISFLTSGILEIYYDLNNQNKIPNWGWNLAFGILTTMVGILLLIHPKISIATLPFYVGFVIMFRSIMAIAWATNLKNYTDVNVTSIMFMGILGLLFSFILLWNPILAGLTVIVWTALAFLLIGGTSIYISLKLRKINTFL